MKNLIKLFALALILFVSCDTGLNTNNNKKEEPQEPKLLSFKVKGFVDYDNWYKTQTYAEAAEKLGTEDFVIKLADFETLFMKDSLYITDYFTQQGKEIQYWWDYEADEGYELDETKIEVKSVENVTKDLYSYLGTEEDIVDYFVNFFEEKKFDMCLAEVEEDGRTYLDIYGYGEENIRKKLQGFDDVGLELSNNLKVNLYEPGEAEDDETIWFNFDQLARNPTEKNFEKVKEENNSSIKLEDCIVFYCNYKMDEETGLRKVDENGNYILDTESEESKRYSTGLWYMVQCAKITFELDGCEAVCYVVY